MNNYSSRKSGPDCHFARGLLLGATRPVINLVFFYVLIYDFLNYSRVNSDKLNGLTLIYTVLSYSIQIVIFF